MAPHGLRVGGAEHLFQDLEDVEAAEAAEAVLAATNGEPAESAGGRGLGRRGHGRMNQGMAFTDRL